MRSVAAVVPTTVSARTSSITQAGAAGPAADPSVPGVGAARLAGMVLTSKDKARLAGKQLFHSEYRMKSCHSLNAAARMLCDDVAKSETFIISAALQADARFLGALLAKDSRGPDATKAKFSQLAQWAWLDIGKDYVVW